MIRRTRSGKHIRIEFSKKASLNLSINAVVVLILAITMLGLGLAFMKKTFGGVTEEFEEVSGEIKVQLIDRLKTSREPLALSTFNVEIEKSSKKTVYLGIRNDLGCGTLEYTVEPAETCESLAGLGEINCEGQAITIQTFETQRVEQNDVGIVPINIRTESTAVPDTVKFPITVTGGCPEAEPQVNTIELLVSII
ncbi:hypothetical protein GF371_02180 [Candidatus Woesearchaeota archaeon]|nr:hypothetical protein [Candidatus Woesearchaeota archaeon]